MVAEKRNYIVKNAQNAKEIAFSLLKQYELDRAISFGLPEIDDRTHVWRVPIKREKEDGKIGEVVIDAKTSLVNIKKSTDKDLLEARLLNRNSSNKKDNNDSAYSISTLRNTIGFGDSELLIDELPAESIDLIFTSPPYFNAKPEYTEYLDYDEYLFKMRKIIRKCHRVLSDGRFFAINTSPVLIRRASRNESSKRIAVPFDFHRIFIEEGYEFIDDIIWKKPDGVGWATGRGRRFSADRNALQYKSVPVTEYVLVYRKQSGKLIDWYIRNHPDREIIEESRIIGEYDVTNIWDVKPAFSKDHPAIFPEELAKRVIRYYSFINDVVFDPFAGIGTVGKAAVKLQRKFVLFDINAKYINIIKSEMGKIFLKNAKDVLCLNCSPIDIEGYLF